MQYSHRTAGKVSPSLASFSLPFCLLCLASVSWAQTTITLGTNSLTFGHGAGTGSLVVAGEWSASTYTPWLHISTSSGSSETLFLFTYDANFGPTRTGTIEFNGTAATLTVTQAGVNYVPARELTTIAELTAPYGLALDASGNLYIADNNENGGSIKEWVAATGQVLSVVSRIAESNGSGWYSGEALGVAVDNAGNLYVASDTEVDYFNPFAYPFTSLGEACPLITGFQYPNYPKGLALNAAGGVYVSAGDLIQNWKGTPPASCIPTGQAHGELTTLISGISSPSIALDAASNLYIGDASNERIVKLVPSTGEIKPLLSNVVPSITAVDAAGNVYFSNQTAVQKWSPITRQTTGLASDSDGVIMGVATDPTGNKLYISDESNLTPRGARRLTHSFVGPAAVVEPLSAGSDQLLPVLPASMPVDAVSDQPWLTIASQDNGIVKFSFTAAMEPRTAHISVLGQTIPVTQIDENKLTPVFFRALWRSESYTLTGSTRNRLPWEITGIQVVFSHPILSADTASLSGVAVTGLSGLGTNTLTWTINPLSVGSFTVALAETGPHAVRDSFGNTLRGNVSQTVRVLLGDFNDDGVVNAADLSGVNQARVNSYNLFADLNGDDAVDANDVQIVRNQIGKTLP